MTRIGCWPLQEIEAGESFAVVVSDYRMPEMDGVTFLTRVRELAPDTVRIMLTGQAGLEATIDAINESDVFRFLTKPCPPETLIATIESAAEHYGLLHAEKELLDGTLQQIVRVLIELIGLVDPGKKPPAGRGPREDPDSIHRFADQLQWH